MWVNEIVKGSTEGFVVVVRVGKEAGIFGLFLKLINVLFRVIDFAIFLSQKVEVHVSSGFVEDFHVLSDLGVDSNWQFDHFHVIEFKLSIRQYAQIGRL